MLTMPKSVLPMGISLTVKRRSCLVLLPIPLKTITALPTVTVMKPMTLPHEKAPGGELLLP